MPHEMEGSPSVLDRPKVVQLEVGLPETRELPSKYEEEEPCQKDGGDSFQNKSEQQLPEIELHEVVSGENASTKNHKTSVLYRPSKVVQPELDFLEVQGRILGNYEETWEGHQGTLKNIQRSLGQGHKHFKEINLQQNRGKPEAMSVISQMLEDITPAKPPAGRLSLLLDELSEMVSTPTERNLSEEEKNMKMLGILPTS